MSGGRPRLAPLMLRELRGSAGRMVFFVVCLAVGVAAVVAVAGVSEGLDAGLRREGRGLLAADLAVEGRDPLPAEVGVVLGELAGGRGWERVDVRELVTMVSVDGPAGPAGGAAEEAPPPGRRETLPAEGSTRASAQPAPNLDGPEKDDESAGFDALRTGPPPRPLPPTSPADDAVVPPPASGGKRGERRGSDSENRHSHAARRQDEGWVAAPSSPREGGKRVGEMGGDPMAAPSSPPRGGEGTGLGGRSQLVELKVVDGDYPFYGELVLEPARPLGELLAGDGVVAAPELLERLGLSVGDVLFVGGLEARVSGVVLSEPDRLGGAFGFSAGPRLFVGAELFDRTGLETLGSRIRYRTLVRLPETAERDAAEQWAEALRSRVRTGRVNVETWTEAQPALRTGLARAERFLGLVALLSLLVGGIGVGQTVRAWLAGRLDAVAVLKVIGFRPREIALVYGAQVALLGVAGSLAGAVAGVALVAAAPRLAGDVVPAGLIDPLQPWAIARGLALGVGVALLFGLPSLGSVLRVPPVRVLRRAVEALPPPRSVVIATGVAVVAGVWTSAAVQSGSWVLGAQFTGGALAAAGLLALAALAISRAAAALPRERAAFGGRFWLRHGIASLARPGAATLTAVVALGLGVMVVVALWLVERRLTDALVGNLPEEAPSVFLIDIQPDQWQGVQEIFQEVEATAVDSVPVVMARLSRIDGVDVRELAPPDEAAGERSGLERQEREEGERRWALTREQRLTYLEELPEDNRIVAGELWSAPGVPEVSVEEEFARDLGVGLGSTLRFDVQGVPVELAVTSLRTVDWSTFGINFFLVVEPGVLDRAPQQRIAAAQIPPGSETRFQDRIAASYPNVTVLRVREILDKVVTALRRVSDGVRFVGGFTVLAGMAILAGAVSAGALRRRREVALLKTLGTTRAGVIAVYAVEYALVGLVAGAIGCTGATLLARAVLVRGMEVEWVLEPLPLVAALATTVALTVVAGLAASARALQSRPATVLRSH